jgi:hypothetical protein
MNKYKIFWQNITFIEIKTDGFEIELDKNLNPILGGGIEFNNLQEAVNSLKVLISKYPKINLNILEI